MLQSKWHAAGIRLYDVKTTKFTIKTDNNEKKNSTTGFSPNILHSGSNPVQTLLYKLKTMVVLAGVGTSAE